jgi:hypothetical protein
MWIKGAGGLFEGSTPEAGRAGKIAALKARVASARAAHERSVQNAQAKAGKVGRSQAERSMFDLRPGQRVHSELPRRAGTYVVKLSALTSAARPAGLEATNRESGIREALRRRIKFGAIKVHATASGKLEVHDGNNRLAVARERGERVAKVRLTREAIARIRAARASSSGS